MHFSPISLRRQAAAPSTSPTVAAKPSKSEQRQEKIAGFFDKLEQADNKRANPAATRAYIHTRIKLDEKKAVLHQAMHTETQDKARVQQLENEVKLLKTDQPRQDEKKAELQQARQTEANDKARVRELEKEVKLLKKDVQALYATGPQGLSPAILKKKRKGQLKAAWLEGQHTLFGARLPAAVAGIAGAEVATAGQKTAIHQALGYGPESVLSAILRIVSEVPQMRINKDGKPKMPSNLAATSDFQRNNPALKAARANVESTRDTVAAALALIPEDGPPREREELEALNHQLNTLLEALRSGDKCLDIDQNLWILLERELRGKKASAVVSVLAGFASTGALAIEPSGAAAIAAHTLLCLVGSILQIPASVFDYMDGNVDYPQKISAKKIDLALLLKPSALDKKPADLEDEDIDTSIAVKLYDEQPQLVRDAIRGIALHAIGDLNGKRLELQQELNNDRHLHLLPSPLRFDKAMQMRREQKNKELHKVNTELRKLQTQLVLFEQHRHDQLDPDGLIGRAIAEPLYFCRKGISANIFNKMGELLSQSNQRFNNYLNPFLSVGLASAAQDIVTNVVGAHFVQDAIHSFDHTGPHNPAAEQATIAIASMSGFAAVNSGVTVGPARFNKTAYDRKTLGAPAYISNGKGITADDRAEQVKQAFDNGVLSKRKKKKLDKAISVLTAAENPDPDAVKPAADDTARMQEKWNRFERRREHVNKTIREIEASWVFPQYDAYGQPSLDHKGKPIVIDARTTAACHGHYVSAWKRTGVLAWGIPKSMWQSMRFWKDSVASMREGDKWSKLVADGKIVDPALNELINRMERLLQPQDAPRVELGIGELIEAAELVDEVSIALARNTAKKIEDLAALEIWSKGSAHAHEDLERAEFREEIELTCTTLKEAASMDLTMLDEESANNLRECLETFGNRVRPLHQFISNINAAALAEETRLASLYRHQRLAKLESSLEESMNHIDSIRASLQNTSTSTAA